TIPTTADPTEMPIHFQGNSPPRTQTKLTIVAATTPASVPCRLTAPSMPAGTCFQVVIRRAFSLLACPTSLETVSAAASENDAAAARRKITFFPRRAYTARQPLATPK